MADKSIKIIIVAIIFVVSALIFTTILILQSKTDSLQAVQGSSVLNPSIINNDEVFVQKINMSVKNGNYYPSILVVKKDQPVEITLDNSVRGCYRYFTVEELGLELYSKDPSKLIIFTPTQRGTYSFKCNKGLGDGKLIVN
ncbi:MAG TPA: cupredoxin domain-containing protein [Candidatus Paceibacterota bacterium]|nr:cupredoxin domain-containing protein [Candidatus Paceibacterota bacterium]